MLMLVSLMLRDLVTEVPPPGAGLTTVILAEPWLAIALAGTLACSLVGETKVVERAVPFHVRTESWTKLLVVDVAVRVKPGPPARTEVGASLLSTGAGALTAK